MRIQASRLGDNDNNLGHTRQLVGSLFPSQGPNPGPWQRKLRVLTTGLPGNSLDDYFLMIALKLNILGKILHK